MFTVQVAKLQRVRQNNFTTTIVKNIIYQKCNIQSTNAKVIYQKEEKNFSPNVNRTPATCSMRKLLYSTPKDVNSFIDHRNLSDKEELDSDFESDFKDIPTSESKENEHIDPECHMVNAAVECCESDIHIISDFLGEIDKVGHKATFIKFFSMALNKQFPFIH